MDFTGIFNGEALTLEQFNERTGSMKLADLSGGEYVAKGKYDADVQKLKAELGEAKNAITALEASKGDAEALQAELDRYKAAEEKRQQEAAEAAARAELLDRFNRAKGDSVFSSEYAESGVLEAFAGALKDPANKGRGDNDIFAELTKDRDGVFKSKNPPANMGGIGRAETEGSGSHAGGTFFF